jgi:hypothetical protein
MNLRAALIAYHSGAWGQGECSGVVRGFAMLLKGDMGVSLGGL